MSLTALGCGARPSAVANQSSPARSRLVASAGGQRLARVTSRKPDPQGRVMVLMYHHIDDSSDGPMFRSRFKFRRDLETLHAAGFRPVTMTEYVTNKMKLAPGAMPVVFTFDDAHPNQFRLKPDGSIDPTSAVGIWTEFAKTHPDFPVKATWYVLPIMWGDPKTAQKKVTMLQTWGSEIGNHTVTHRDLRRAPADKVIYEVGEMNLRLQKYGVPATMPFAPPYGSFPRNRAVLKSTRYKGQTITHSSACQAGWCPSFSPNAKQFNAFDVLRVHGNGRKYGIDYWLAELKAGRWKPYVAK